MLLTPPPLLKVAYSYTYFCTIMCFSELCYAAPSCTELYNTVLYCTLQNCTILYSIVLYCIVLNCIIYYCTVLYWTLQSTMYRVQCTKYNVQSTM